MTKHTLRNLSEEQNIIPKAKTKKPAPKTHIKPLIVPIVSIIVLVIFTIIANYHTFFKTHFYVDASYLNVGAITDKNIFNLFCLIIIFPFALTCYAFIRTVQKKQRGLSILCGITILLSLLSPLITVNILDGIATSHSDQVMIAIETPDGHSCSIVGYNNRAKSDCPELTHVTFSANMPDGVFTPIRDGADYIIVYLDQTKNITNFDQQNIKVCSLATSDQSYRCNDFKYSDNSDEVIRDDYYSYSYSGNHLTIKHLSDEPKVLK